MKTIRQQYAWIVSAFAIVATISGVLVISTFWLLITRNIEFSVGRQFDNILVNFDNQLQEINLVFNTQKSLSSYMAYYYDQHGRRVDISYLKNTRTFANDIARGLYGVTDFIDYFAVIHENGQVLLEYTGMQETYYKNMDNISDTDLFRAIRSNSSFLYSEKNSQPKLYIAKTIVHSKGQAVKHYLVLRIKTFNIAGLKAALSIALQEFKRSLPVFDVPLHGETLQIRLQNQILLDDGIAPKETQRYLIFRTHNKLTGLDFAFSIPKQGLYIYLIKCALFVALVILSPIVLLFILLYRQTSDVALCFAKIRDHIDFLLKKTDYTKKFSISDNYPYKEFHDVASAFNHLTAKLHDYSEDIKSASKAAAIGQTTAMLAHDVRKPFSMVKMLLSALDTIKDNPSELGRARSEIGKAMESVDGMIADIMDFSREVKLDVRPESLHAILDFSVRQAVRTHGGAKITFTYRLSHKTKPMVDEQRISRAFVNIIDNAIEAISIIGRRDAGIINIESSDHSDKDGRYVEICISNDGPPIPEGVLPRIFDFFFTSGKNKGTGLGLSSVAKIMNLHGGTIAVENIADGRGVKFIMRLPASDKEDAGAGAALPSNIDEVPCGEAACCDVPLEEAIAEISRFKSEVKILLLEDEPLYRAAIRDIIKSNAELHRIIVLYETKHIEDALQLVRSAGITHAIVDIDLNDVKNGFDFLEEIKKDFPSVSCMVHSNRTLKEDADKARSLGAKAFVPKPMSIRDLVFFLAPAACRGQSDKKSPSDRVVLVCDDEMLGRKCMGISIKKAAPGAEVHLFHNAESLLAKLKSFLALGRAAEYVVFTDQNMDGMTGLELTAAIRELKVNCKIYMVSNEFLSEIKNKALAAGADDCFEAPIQDTLLGKLLA